MSAAQKKREAAIIADRERKELLLKKAGEAGLLRKDEELPPEDMDRKDVSKTIATSFLSLIPYTKAWYESQAAETEMDDLQKIRIERSKADDLLAMTKMGPEKAEEALAIMRSETDRDFFFFNKLRHKLEEEGKETVEVPIINPFAKFEKGVTRNRIRKANNSSFAMISGGGGVKLPGLDNNSSSASGDKSGKRVSRDTPCSWRGKSKEGEFLQCSNLRCPDPARTYKTDGGEELHELFSVCCFHIKECIGELHLATHEKITIQLPNDEGLCTECFFQKKKRKPPSLKAHSMPGVGPAVVKLPPREKNELDELLEEEAQQTKAPEVDLSKLNEKSKCKWKPNASEIHMREYECLNTIMIHPETKVFLPTCAYHVRICLRPHDGGTNAAVTIPNCYGLCTMHYTATHSRPPAMLPFPYPGMKKRIGRNAWKIKVGHWASPNWAPQENRHAAVYEPPYRPDTYLQLAVDGANNILYFRRKWRFGKKAALKIQTAYRAYRYRNHHKEIFFRKRLQRRICAVSVIQAQMRRFLGNRIVQKRRHLFNKSAERIQSRYRGYKYRMRRYILWAANRLKKFFRRLNFMKLKDTVITIMQLKRIFKKKVATLTRIQKFWRGYQGRYFVWRVRLRIWITNRAARAITRCIRAFIIWKRNSVAVVSEEEIETLRVRNVLRIITRCFLKYKQRRHQHILQNASAETVQRLVRGYLGRTGTARLKELREVMRQWCEPQYANEFLKKFLIESKTFYHKTEEAVIEPPAPPPLYVRQFLEQKSAATVDFAEFTPALEKWYDFCHLTLLSAEKDSIIRRFQIPGTSQVNMNELEIYFHMHKVPCRKHGRRICGDCIYYRECLQGKCQCPAHQFNGSVNAVCKRCNHPPTLHRKCPAQVKKSKGNKSLLGILNASREADLSIPSSVIGNQLKDVLIPPINEDDQRREYIANMKETQRQSLEDFWERMPLSKELSYSWKGGDTIAVLDEYWDQPSTFDMITADETKSALTLDVATHHVSPDYDGITEAEFWSSTSKNPNKSLRDYDEKFEHNLPLPIVHEGRLLYTFEGPKIYLNIVLQIIKMEEKVCHDDPEFLRLIMNYIQIFERHWRKMVADIRVGFMNRNLDVPEDIKTTFESINYPRPQLAQNLDATFRQLGFHKKVLGKDIKLSKFAPKRHPKGHFVDPRTIRRLSLPSRQLADGPTNLQNTFMNSDAVKGATAATSLSRLSSAHSPLKNRATTPPPSSSSLTINSKLDLNEFSFTDTNRQGLTSASSTNGKKKSLKDDLARMSTAMKNGALEALHQNEKDNLVRGPNHRSRGDRRRGSDPDIQRPVTAAEVNEVFNKNVVAPRQTYSQLLQTDDLRFICPFPACGLCFTTKEAAFAHLPMHEQKNRLQIPTPQTDAHIQFFWPRDVPWKDNEIYNKRIIPPGSIPCPIGDCAEVCSSQDRLKTHIRLVHSKMDASSIHRKYFTFEGQSISVPPYDPPFESKVRWCPNHLIASGKCPVCIEIEGLTNQPKPPFKFYSGSVNINFIQKFESIKHIPLYATSKLGRHENKLASLELHDPLAALVIRETRHMGANRVAGDFKAIPIGCMLDKSECGWIAVRRLISSVEATMRGKALPPDFDTTFEVLMGSDLDDVGMSMWIPIASVINIIKVFRMEKKDFRAKRKASEIPSNDVFFIRPES